LVLDFYGLREPFGVTADARFLFLSPAHRKALASLMHGLTLRDLDVETLKTEPRVISQPHSTSRECGAARVSQKLSVKAARADSDAPNIHTSSLLPRGVQGKSRAENRSEAYRALLSLAANRKQESPLFVGPLTVRPGKSITPEESITSERTIAMCLQRSVTFTAHTPLFAPTRCKKS